MFKRIILILILVLVYFITINANDGDAPDVNTIIEKSDNIMYPRNLRGSFAIKLISKNQDTRLIKVNAYQKLVSESRTDRLFLFIFPPSIRGTGLLVHSYLESDKDKMWIYLPAVGKIKRVALDAAGGGYFMGSDFTYSDLISKGSEEFNLKLTGEKMIGDELCYEILAVGKDESVKKKIGYSKEIRYYRKKDFVQVKIIFYDMAEELLKEYTVHKVKSLGDYLYPSKITMENKQTGHKSIIDFYELTAPKNINNKYFTYRFLQNQ